MTEQPIAVTLLSGGLDSTTLLYSLRDDGYKVMALSADYSQKHAVELSFAKETCKKLGVRHELLNLTGVENAFRGSALTGGVDVPEGHYAEATMAQTVVPNRNAIFLALAYGIAVQEKATKVCTAVHAGDHAIYPDCRPEFIKAFEEMERVAITREIYGTKCPSLYAPFLMMTKAQIISRGAEVKVPWTDTWSCYNGDLSLGHCGRCGTCVERIGAFNVADVADTTRYNDTEFAVHTLREKGEWVDR